MHSFLEVVLSNALTATVMAVGVALLGWLVKRPAFLHLLWVFVLLKLVTPPIVTVPLSVSLDQTLGSSEPIAAMPIDWNNEPSSTNPEETLLTEEELAAFVERGSAVAPEILVDPLETLEAQTPRDVFAAWLSSIPLAGWLVACWCFGSAAWLGTAIYRIARFHALLRLGHPGAPALQDQAEAIAQRLGLAYCPEVWVIPGRVSPLLWSMGASARLVLPRGLLGQLDLGQVEALLAHELAHARRRDHWVRWLELLVTSLYWWHPVAWWARREISLAEEQCCDAWVVWLYPQAAKTYARALLQTVTYLDARPSLPPVASGAGHVQQLRRRLSMIVNGPRFPGLSRPLCSAALGLGMFMLAIAPLGVQASTLMSDEEQQAQKSKQSSDDVQRRIRQLEQKLEEALKALDEAKRSAGKQGADSRDEERAKAAARAKEAATRAKEAAARSAEARAKDTAARDAERAARERTRAKEAQEKAAKARDEAKAKASLRVKEALKEATKDKKPDAVSTPRRVIIDGKVLDFGKGGDWEKQMREALEQAMGPDRAKDIEKKVQEALNKAMSPERMKQIEKQVQEAVNKSLSPERMKQIEVQIQQAMDKGFNPQKMDEIRKKIDEAMSKRGKALEQLSRTPARPAEKSDLERRMDSLEKKMDRVLKLLEQKRS